MQVDKEQIQQTINDKKLLEAMRMSEEKLEEALKRISKAYLGDSACALNPPAPGRQQGGVDIDLKKFLLGCFKNKLKEIEGKIASDPIRNEPLPAMNIDLPVQEDTKVEVPDDLALDLIVQHLDPQSFAEFRSANKNFKGIVNSVAKRGVIPIKSTATIFPDIKSYRRNYMVRKLITDIVEWELIKFPRKSKTGFSIHSQIQIRSRRYLQLHKVIDFTITKNFVNVEILHNYGKSEYDSRFYTLLSAFEKINDDRTYVQVKGDELLNDDKFVNIAFAQLLDDQDIDALINGTYFLYRNNNILGRIFTINGFFYLPYKMIIDRFRDELKKELHDSSMFQSTIESGLMIQKQLRDKDELAKQAVIDEQAKIDFKGWLKNAYTSTEMTFTEFKPLFEIIQENSYLSTFGTRIIMHINNQLERIIGNPSARENYLSFMCKWCKAECPQPVFPTIKSSETHEPIPDYYFDIFRDPKIRNLGQGEKNTSEIENPFFYMDVCLKSKKPHYVTEKNKMYVSVIPFEQANIQKPVEKVIISANDYLARIVIKDKYPQIATPEVYSAEVKVKEDPFYYLDLFGFKNDRNRIYRMVEYIQIWNISMLRKQDEIRDRWNPCGFINPLTHHSLFFIPSYVNIDELIPSQVAGATQSKKQNPVQFTKTDMYKTLNGRRYRVYCTKQRKQYVKVKGVLTPIQDIKKSSARHS